MEIRDRRGFLGFQGNLSVVGFCWTKTLQPKFG
jgi:hypothetical protein